MNRAFRLIVVAWVSVSLTTVAAQDEAATPSPYAEWSKGPSTADDYFPIAVWVQNPSNAQRYKEIGINLFVGLWRGPTEEQLDQLDRAGMQVICAQNQTALSNLERKTIVGWLQNDEPDNAQARREGGWGPPIRAEEVQERYQRMRRNDPDRPVLLNLGMGVAWDGWYGRGVRTNKPEDYPQYVRAGDILSFDIYPVTSEHDEVAGNLWFVPKGVGRLRTWTDDKKPIWNCIECTHINNPDVKPTPYQVRAEVWMSLIHGSQGLIYFVHQFEPKFIEAGLLADDEMTSAVRQLNTQIRQLAPVLNSPTLDGAAMVASTDADVPFATMVKRHGGATYLFAVAMRDKPAQGSFMVTGLPAESRVEVLGERRRLDANDGAWQDDFKGYEVHLYRVETNR